MRSVPEVPSHENMLAVVVSEHWLDAFCEQVGSLSAVLQALAKLNDHRPHTLVAEALDTCAALQDLMNVIPVWSGPVPPQAQAAHAPVSAGAPPSDEAFTCDWSSPWVPLPLGDSFPEFQHRDEDQLPVVDRAQLAGNWDHDAEQAVQLLQNFRQRADADLRELQLLSVGRDWTRLSRLAGALKDAAAHVSATRIVVDAAALQGAARIGCRHDVDLALDALKADVRACAKLVDEWLAAAR
jgi:HPt (histidine-containing phosphotransfer) domain-containing protein